MGMLETKIHLNYVIMPASAGRFSRERRGGRSNSGEKDSSFSISPSAAAELQALDFQDLVMFLQANHILIQHPQLTNYDQVYNRARAVNGFKKWRLLHEKVIQELGRRGMAWHPGAKQHEPLLSRISARPTVDLVGPEESCGARATGGCRWRRGHGELAPVAAALTGGLLTGHELGGLEVVHKVHPLFQGRGIPSAYTQLP